MTKSCLSRGSLIGAVGEKSSDEALSVFRDGLPGAVLEGELSLAHLLHDVLVRLSVEGGHA